jgi:hypothetical protein
MELFLSLFGKGPNHSDSLSVDGTTIIAATTIFFVVSSIYLLFQADILSPDRPYPSIPLVGKDASTTSTSAAKTRWVTSARQIISSGLKGHKPFQVLATVRPMIILPARYIDEIKNHANFNFAKAVESNFYGKYPGFDGLNSLNQNEVFQDAIKVKLTQGLSMFCVLLKFPHEGNNRQQLTCARRSTCYPACPRSRCHCSGNVLRVKRYA